MACQHVERLLQARDQALTAANEVGLNLPGGVYSPPRDAILSFENAKLIASGSKTMHVVFPQDYLDCNELNARSELFQSTPPPDSGAIGSFYTYDAPHPQAGVAITGSGDDYWVVNDRLLFWLETTTRQIEQLNECANRSETACTVNEILQAQRLMCDSKVADSEFAIMQRGSRS